MSEIKNGWEEFLNPDVLRPKLISASIFLAAYALLLDTVIDRIASFYSTGLPKKGDQVDAKYKEEVLSRNSSPLYASLSWLQENKAIDEKDLLEFEHIKNSRNQVAHELYKIASDNISPDFLEQFPILMALINKIERWWIINFEIPVNPDMDGKEIEESGIVPGSIIILQIMLDIALGSHEKAQYYINEFRKLSSSHNTS